jgi:hypothetical protein
MFLMNFCTQQSLDGNTEKSSKLYEHCDRFVTTPEQFVKLLDALEQSENLTALQILDPDHENDTKVPDSRIEVSAQKRTHISTLDVARILHYKTNLSEHWSILREALQINEGNWNKAVQKSQTAPLLDVIKFIFGLIAWVC